jgi:DNA-binding transcriptional MerR regulator
VSSAGPRSTGQVEADTVPPSTRAATTAVEGVGGPRTTVLVQEATMQAPNVAGQLALDVGDAVVREGYRGTAVVKIVGITYRQLDYWARTGLVEPSVRRAEGSGTQRLYSFDDIVRLRVVKRLLDTGVSLQKVRRAVDELRARGRSLADATLVSHGDSVYLLDDDAQLVDLLKRGQGVFAIALGPVIDELEGEVTAFPTERLEDAPVPTASVEVDAAQHG